MNAWIIKLAADGKMIWNKEVGEGYNDELSFLEVTRQNQILGIGHTWMGTDSASRESWIFRLGTDGQKLWSKKLGSLHVNCVLTRDGTILLGGYEVKDTAGEQYAMVALNENGKRLWSRTYTGKGEIVVVWAKCLTVVFCWPVITGVPKLIPVVTLYGNLPFR